MMALFSGIGLPLSGLANHLLGFDPLTVQRHAWMAAHNVMGVTFAVFAGWHIALNRRTLANYFRSAVLQLPRREAVTAGLFIAGLLTFAVGHTLLAGRHM